MKVHVVTNDWESDQILARLARELIVRTGWSCGPRVERDAINYFFPYLNLSNARRTSLSGVRTAAWFTHYDVGQKSKESAWVRCASAVELRTTCADMYCETLSKYGTCAIVTPPVDTEKFKPSEVKRSGAKHRVGVSGYVYKGGRKGEALVEQLYLASAPNLHDFELVASGKGWPCPTTEYSWDRLQDFYHSIDIYLCTATVEGIPMPPLEAMACGIPVVIPRKVGILDELPALQNVHRYTAGDFDSMSSALLSAFDEQVNMLSLRNAALPYSVDAWIDTHLDAFDKQFGERVFTPGPLPDWAGHAGVYCVAYGDPARECAMRLIKSIRKHMPGLPVAVVSDRPLKGADIFVEHEDSDIGARSVKTQIYDLAPKEWDYVLYLDSDTELVGDISFLFQLLADGWKLAFCYNPAKYVLASQMRRKDNTDECEQTFEAIGTDQLLQYNGGVFAFRRCDKTKRFFKDWVAEWDKWGARDQAALDRALYSNPIRVYTLGMDYNLVDRYETQTSETAIVHHPMQARRWRGRINGRLDSTEAWGAVHPQRGDKP